MYYEIDGIENSDWGDSYLTIVYELNYNTRDFGFIN